MKEFLFYDFVFTPDEIFTLQDECDKANWGRLDDPIFGNRDVQHGNFKSPPASKLIHAYINSLEQRPHECLVQGIQNCGGNFRCDEKLARYNTGDDLDWHCGDWAYYNHPYPDAPHIRRQLTAITYLNDDFDGGETEFKDDIISPQTGKTLIFPAHWEFAHRGKAITKGIKFVYINHIWF